MTAARPAAAPNNTPSAPKLQRHAGSVAPREMAERHDAATVPWAVAGIGAIAYAGSEAWRLGELPPTEVLAACGGVALLSLGAALLSRRVSARSWQLVLLLAALIAASAAIVVPALTLGLTAVTVPVAVVVAAYAGLTLPYSIVLTAVLLASIGGVHLAQPVASTVDAISLLVLIVVGWLFGRFCGAVHRRARRLAMQLARTDRLVHTLNRRGFTEELAHRLSQADPDHSVALMVLDLVDFKEVNERLGATEGDALLASIGDRLAKLLPATAIAGRLGGDEFAVAVTGLGDQEVRELAVTLQLEITKIHAARIGVASAQHAQLGVSDLLRSADGAARRCREAGADPVQHLVAGQTAMPPAGKPAPDPLLTYERLRSLGGRPTKPSDRLLDGRAQRDGFLWLAAAGAVVWGAELTRDAHTDAGLIVMYGGAFWFLLCMIFAMRGALQPDRAAGGEVMVGASVVAGAGIAIAAGASGGVSAPVVGGLYLLALVAAALARGGFALTSVAAVILAYAGLQVIAPVNQLWAIPFQLTALAGAFALGRVGRTALDGVTEEWIAIARTDQLTGLLNRFGFNEELQRWGTADPSKAARYAVFTFDLDGFRAANADGYQAGDAILRDVGQALTGATAGGLAARRGADEFVAALPIDDPTEADRILRTIARQVTRVHPASAGVAIYPDDGASASEVLRISDLRARTAKLEKRAAAIS